MVFLKNFSTFAHTSFWTLFVKLYCLCPIHIHTTLRASFNTEPWLLIAYVTGILFRITHTVTANQTPRKWWWPHVTNLSQKKNPVEHTHTPVTKLRPPMSSWEKGL